MFPGLAAGLFVNVWSGERRREGQTLLIVLLRRLVYDSTVFKTPQIEHSYTTIGATAHKHINAIGTKSDIKHFFVMGYQLSLGCKRWDIPYCTSGIDARGND